MTNLSSSGQTSSFKIQADSQSPVGSGIFVVICLLPILSTLLFGAVDNTTWVLLTALCAMLTIMWIVLSWRSGRISFSGNSLQIPLIGILLLGLIQLLPFSTTPAANIPVSIPISNAISIDPQATRFFLSRLAVYFVFFAACLTFIQSEERVKKTVLMIIIFGSAMAFFGILQRLANPDGIYGMRETPQAAPFGPFVNQHHFASFMQMTSGVTLGFLLGSHFKRDKKILLAIATVVMGVAVILTGSRGGLIGLISVVSLVGILSLILDRKAARVGSMARKTQFGRRVAVGVGTVALLTVVFGIALFVGGEDSLLRGIGMTLPDTDVTTGRSYIWSIALQIFWDNPLIGVGWDAFGTAFTRYDTRSGLFRVEQAHNEYLQFLSEAGILGFICLASFIYLLFRRSLQTITAGVGLVREASIGALAGCFGIIIHSFFDFPLRTHSNGFFFLLLSAVAVCPVLKRKNT